MKKKVNQSELIRNMMEKSPGAKATEIIALLKQDGVTVSFPLVYQAMRKSSSTKAKTAIKRGRKDAAVAPPVDTSSNANELFSAMQSFVNAAGSLDKAIKILSVFKK